MNVKPLVETILAASVFLEQGSDDDVDPDWAVKTLENMAHSLGRVPAEDVPEVLAAFEEIAAEADAAGHVDWARFVRSQPFALGLVDDDPTEAS
ncbi:hypothetical protein L1785_10115 [Antribacter sp. KLBMP9083]|uniref:Uncharacterized protein n=1 Tax=Antribacter soli TaxID=2910976 RepID=A0AA41U988_9MICO|nr:hypothetical protein [Antribacter soli]MCF4121337.1 hypothetical protein [Antribacter soli]